MQRRGRTTSLALAALVSALLAGCTAGPSSRPPVVENEGPRPEQQSPSTDQPVPLPPLTEPRSSSIEWADCDAQTRERLSTSVPETVTFSCSRVTTMLDAPGRSRRGIERVAVLRAGSGPIPLAVVNEIGGEPGTLYAARLAGTLPPEILQRFSLIGMDRRGTGESDPINCISEQTRLDLVSHDPAADDLEPVLDAARRAGQQCAISLDNEQAAYDSWRAAGDLEEIRDQLGVPHLNAIAHGEGSRVLTAYAVRFGDRVGRFVLDGVPDPNENAAAVLGGIAAGAETTLDAFGADCARRECPLGADARAAVTRLAETLRTRPLLTPRRTVMGPALALRAVLAGLRQPHRWPELGEAIAAAQAGDAAGLAAFNALLAGGTSRLRPARLDAVLVTRCNDTATRLPADRIDRIGAEFRNSYPVFGGVLAQRLAWCSPWPVRQEPLPPAGTQGVPPILVASTATDPATPETGTIRAAQQIPSAVRVSWQGAGHGALASPCVADAVQNFLVDGTVPRDGTLCPA